MFGNLKKILGGGSILGAIVAVIAGSPYSWAAIPLMIAGGFLMQESTRPPEENIQYKQQLNVRSSRTPLPLIYGKCIVGVNKTYYYVNNPNLYIIAEIGEGPLNGIIRDDGTVFTDTATSIESTRNSAPVLIYFDEKLWTTYGGSDNYVYVEFFNGADGQDVCQTLKTVTAGKWNENLKHTAYLFIRLKFDIDIFKSEPNITLKVSGLKVDDPIADTNAFSQNGALCAYDFITRSAVRGGVGIPASKCDLTTLETSRDYVSTKGWTCNLAITGNQPVADNLDHILLTYRGAVFYSDGKIKFAFADLNYETPTGLNFDEDDIVSGSLRIEMPDTSKRSNAIKATYRDAKKYDKLNDYTFSSEADIIADGDFRELSVPMYGFNNIKLVQKMCNYFLERERLRQTITFVSKEKGKVLEPYDLITITHSMPGWADKTIRVLSANINPDDTVSLSCVNEELTLYDDTYNLTGQDFNDTDLLDPNAVSSVTDFAISETTYVYRLRTFSRAEITFSPPDNYPWFDHVEVWVSINAGTTWKHQYDSTDDFTIDPVEEGKTYYIKLVVVNIFGASENFNSAPVRTLNVAGKMSDAPDSLSNLRAITNGQAVNLYSDKVDDPDVELYEFRLGASWSGAVFLGALRAPNLSLSGVRPGNHTFWANTLGANGLYGDTPRSAAVSIPSPPKGFVMVSTAGPNVNRVTNGDFELDSDWLDYGTPSINSRTTGAAYEGTYGRRFVVASTGAEAGIRSTAMTLTQNEFGISFWVWPEGATDLKCYVFSGDGSTSKLLDTTFVGLTQSAWNFCRTTFSGVGGAGSSASLVFATTKASTMRVDNAIILRGNYSSCVPYMYNSDDFIINTRNTSVVSEDSTFSGRYYTQDYDLSTNYTGLFWVDSSYAVLGSGGNWDDVLQTTSTPWNNILNSTKTWSELFAPEAAPRIKTKLVYGETTSLGSTVENMEILSAYITARYVRVQTSVIDPAYNIYGIYKAPTIRIAT